MWTLFVANAAAIGTSGANPAAVVHPDHYRGGTADSVVWVDVGDDPGDVATLKITNDAGLVFPATLWQAGALVRLFPEAPLAFGTYHVDWIDGTQPPGRIGSFEIGDGVEPSWPGPQLEFRQTFAEFDFRYLLTEPQSGVQYDVCTAAPVVLVVAGDPEPGDPFATEIEGVRSDQRWSTEGGWEDATEGNTATLWIGTVDGAGRFSGWLSDEVTLPDDGTLIEERNSADVPDTRSTINTAYVTGSECDAFGGWELVSTTTQGGGCGCDSGSSPPSVLLLAAAALVGRRHRAR